MCGLYGVCVCVCVCVCVLGVREDGRVKEAYRAHRHTRSSLVHHNLSQLNKYLLSSCYVPSIVTGTRDTMVNRTDMVPDMVPGSRASGRYRQVNG